MEQNINHTDGTNTNLRQRAAASGLTKMEQSRTFMGDDKLTIDAIAAQPLDFRVGDTINVHGQKYTINRLPTARKEGERRYSYSVTLEGAQYGLITAQFLLFDNITDDVVANPSQYTLDGLMLNSLSGTAGDILKMIVLNANRVHGDGAWIVGTIPASTDTLNFTLEDGTCLEALQALAEQWELEWEISTDANGKHTINLAKEPTTIPSPLTTFAYGRTGGLYSIERAAKQDDIITRLYAYGSTQNIPTSYLQEANTSRLCIKNGNNRKKHLSYVENATLKQQYGLRESVEVFDEIYPQRVGTVTAIYSSGASFWKKFRDSDMFDLNARDPQTGETLYLIPGATAKVTFQTGQMAGYTFNITDWNNTTKCFTIEEFKEDGDLTLPSETVSNLRIKTGDKYILTDINLPTSYITAAETKLKQYAEKKLAQLNADLYQYTVELDSRYVKKHATGWGRTADNPFKPGDFIAITDSELNTTITLRLTAYTHDLINDTYTLTVELYQPRIKTTQTRRRRWYINDWCNRIAERISINNEYTAERAAEVAATGMDEIIAGRGSYSSLNGRMTAINGTATGASNTANSAWAKALQVASDYLQICRFVNNGNFADRHISKIPTFEGNKWSLDADVKITDTLSKIRNGFTMNEWGIQQAAEIDFGDGNYESDKAYSVYAVLKDDGTTEYKAMTPDDGEIDGTYLLLGDVSAEDGNGERTYTPAIAQSYMDAGVLRDSGGNAVLDIDNKLINGAMKFSGLKATAQGADLDILSVLGALPTTAGGLRKRLGDTEGTVDGITIDAANGKITIKNIVMEIDTNGNVKFGGTTRVKLAKSDDVPTITEVNSRFEAMQTIRNLLNTIYSEMTDWNTRISTWTTNMKQQYPNTPDFPASKSTCAHLQPDEQVCRAVPNINDIVRN